MKLFKIAFSNIRKRKSGAITIFAIVAMAALMLFISLSLLLSVGSFYDNKRTEFNTADLSVYVPANEWQVEMLDYTSNYQGATDNERVEVYYTNARYNLNGKIAKQQFVIQNAETDTRMNKYKLIDAQNIKPADSVVLPLGLKYNGFKSGDKFTLSNMGADCNFTIYGFFEDPELGASTTSVNRIYVNAKAYDELSDSSGFIKYYGLLINFEKIGLSYNFQTDFKKEFNLSSSGFSMTYDTTKLAATMFPLIMSFMLILIAVIVISIALIIIRFSIKNNIEEDIKTLGALKSIGFTSRQLIVSLIIQFLLISLAGGIAGMLIGLLATGYVGNVVSATSGLLWSGSSFFVPALISLLFIIGITVAATYFAAKKSKTITPINALRAGLSNHSFKKNYIPLDKTRLPLNLAAAVKNFFLTIKNNITVFIVLIMFSFSTVLGFTLYHNFVVDTAAFKQMIGAEPASIQLTYQGHDVDFIEKAFAEITARDSVIKTLRWDFVPGTSDNKTIDIGIWEHIEDREAQNVIKGRDAVNENEIALSATMQKVLNKNIGDVINVEYEGSTASYLITGIIQGIGDTYSNMTKEGFMRLKSDVTLMRLYLFLNNTESDYVDAMVDSIKSDYDGDIDAINYDEAIDSTLVSLKDPIAIATYLITAIVIFTVCFVFFLMIDTIIRRRKKDYGIMKALGFTNGQLIIQMLLSFLPVIITGVVIGTIAGVYITNPILGIMFSSLGIVKPLFVIPAPLTIITELSLIAVCILTTYLVSLKTKNISPQKLITE